MTQARRRRTEWLGEGLTALCGGALALNMLLILALLGVLAANGLDYFWQKKLDLADSELKVAFRQRPRVEKDLRELRKRFIPNNATCKPSPTF